ncbi:MAG TPA: immunoglobulin domain-containing protein, partial [Candidatus Acidoferrum sp.]|nr:immunoglobulin domain-containing protein [Candidatus Acidoferrum sp.]
LEFYSINRTNGVRTLINDTITAGAIPAYRTRVGLPAASPPQIVNVSPANNTFFFPFDSPLTFEALAGEGSTIAPTDMHLTLNGLDVSDLLVVGGSDTARTVSFTGLQPNTPYHAMISITDSATRTTTRTVLFDTFNESEVTTVEAEDYNFADTVCPTAFNLGGIFLDPAPPNAYFGFTGIKGVDYWDTSSNAVNNAYRTCDFVGTQVSPDGLRPAYAGTNDYQVWRMQPGEWLNYTRLYVTASYQVYARVASTQARQLTLSKVTSDASAPDQTSVVLGSFAVPNTGGATAYQYVPLLDAFGDPAIIPLTDLETIRLGSVDANNDVVVNFLVLVPASGTPPWLSSVSPLPNATRVQPSASVNVTIANGSTAVNLSTLALTVDGTNVTSDAAITSDSFGTAISYTPPTLWATGLTHTVQLVFQDNGGLTITSSNEWSFSVAAGVIGFPTRVNFGATNSPAPAGYLLDVGEVYGLRTNGFTYGWDRNLIADGRIRNNASSPDLRYDTFMHMLKALPAAFWQIDLPNDTYTVRVVGGDPTAVDSVFQYDIEGTVTGTYIPVAGAWWADFTVSTTVADGQLTLRSGPDSQTVANNNKVCFIDITPPIAPVAPVITRQPASLTVPPGSPAMFTVTYRATDPLTFQWYHDGAPVAGGTGSTLTIPNAQLIDEGAYTVAITNIAGGTVSASAQLIVGTPATTNAVLKIALTGTNVLISWTNTTVGLALNETPDLTPPISWTPTTNEVVNSNDHFNVTLPADAAKKFFSLRE